MDHSLTLITTLVAGFSVALLVGVLAERIKIPALVGYLLAGVAVAQAGPGIHADADIASQFSDIGIMLLMFGVGLHFSPGDLLTVKRIVIPGAMAQMSLATLLGWGLALGWGWSFGSALIFGLSLSSASTVVLLKALDSRGLLDTMNGRIATGWLVFQDLATVLVLVVMPPLAHGLEHQGLGLTVGRTLLQVGAFIALMLIVGRRVLPWLLWQVARTGSRELFTLAVVATALGIAYGASALFSVSFALGAFFAGTVMGESEYSHRAAEESLPLRDAFSVLFFVAIGMVFDPMILLTQPVRVLAVVAVITLATPLAALSLVLMMRYPLNTALMVAASLGQIGDFSIILAGLGRSLGVLPQSGMTLVLAGVLISIALNSFLFAAIEPFRRWVLKQSDLARRLERRDDPFAELPMTTETKYLEGQVVLVGYGRLGRRIAAALDQRGIPYVVAEQNRELVEDLRKDGKAAVSGNAAEAAVLIQAHIARAAMMIVALPDTLNVRTMAAIARKLNPDIEIILRSPSEDETILLRHEHMGAVFYAEDELAQSMCRHVLHRFAPKTA